MKQRHAIQQWLVPLLPIIGLALLVAAQSQFQHERFGLDVAGALASGLVLWLVAILVAPPLRTQRTSLVRQEYAPRWDLVAIAIALGAATWISTGAGVYSTTNVVLWLLTVGVWCWAWWPPAHETTQRNDRQRRWPQWLLLALILVVGAWFRFYRLDEVPLDPTSDHAEKLLDIYDLTQGQRPIFFPRNTGREPGQFYLTFGLMRVLNLPLAFETLKVGTALIGLLAVPAVYLFARELGGRTLGLFAAALFAISKWPVNTARMGLRFPYAPLPTALTLWLLFRYLRRGDRRDALLCGVVIGLGLHGYIAFRIVPLLVPLLLLFALLADRRWRAQPWRVLQDGTLIALTAILTCLPLVRYTVQHPDQVWFRVATRAASTERTLGDWQALVTTFAQNNLNALLAFNWRGDETVVNAVRLDPFLDVVTGGALLAGVLIVGYQVIAQRSTRFAMVCLTLPVLLLPSTLSLAFPAENPSANRLGTVAPIIFTMAALPLAHIAELAGRRTEFRRLRKTEPASETSDYVPHGATKDGSTERSIRRVFVGLSIATAMLLAGQQNFVRYFRDYDLQYRSSVPNIHEIAHHVRRMEAQGVTLDQTYLLAYSHWLDGRNLGLALGDAEWQPNHDLTSDQPLPQQRDNLPMLFVLHPSDTERKTALERQFPSGNYTLIHAAPPGRDFALFLVPAR